MKSCSVVIRRIKDSKVPICGSRSNLKKDRDKLLNIKKVLEGSVNCLPFHQAFVTGRAGFIVRQFIKDSLYDRISTRPFLRPIGILDRKKF